MQRVDGHDLMCNTWQQRRALLDDLGMERPGVRLSDVFDDGQALFDVVVEHGLEGVVAKGQRDLPARLPRLDEDQERVYWRREQEVELIQRRRRVTTTAA